MTWSLMLMLSERLSIVATAAFLFSRSPAFGRLLHRQLTLWDRVLLVVTLSALGILGTYAGIPAGGALANSRLVGELVAGLLGGPLVGIAVGLIAGVHRYMLGGFTALSCALAAVLLGGLGGAVQRWYQRDIVPWQGALLVGAVGEVLQMAIILLTARPLADSWALVKLIGPPMIIVNAVGVAIFVVVVKTAGEYREHIAASQAHQALRIANQTLPFLRRGLTRASAEPAARIIFEALDTTAISITDEQEILAHVGAGSDHHLAGMPIQTDATLHALETGEVQVALTNREIGCRSRGCRLGSAVIAPLKRGETVIGTLKLYRDREKSITPVDVELAQGLAALFSTQLELAELEHQAQLRAQAELKALQAQIHPHFLFNALNVISSMVRIKPEKARELLINLSAFFRHSLNTDEIIPLRDELAHVDAYLAIESARFGDKLAVVREIDAAALDCPVPAFCVQPLVENAVKHGLYPKADGGRVTIRTIVDDEATTVIVEDDGVGIAPQELDKIFVRGYGRGTGLGLAIVNERLTDAVQVESVPGRGTRVMLRFEHEQGGERRGLHRRSS